MAVTTLSSAINNTHMPPRDKDLAKPRAAAQNSIRIAIVGHQDFSLDGLATMIENQNKNVRVFCIEPDEKCLNNLITSNPNCLLIQNDSLPQSFERFIHTLLDHLPGIRILVFGKGMDDDHLYQLVRAGAHGYVNEHMDAEHFCHALNSVLNGNNWIERHILEHFVTSRQSFDELLECQLAGRIEVLCEQLTRRETEILREVIKGLAIKQIAEQVHLSHQGVKMHLAKLFKKFDVRNRNQLILAVFDKMSPTENLSALLCRGLSKKLNNKCSEYPPGTGIRRAK